MGMGSSRQVVGNYMLTCVQLVTWPDAPMRSATTRLLDFNHSQTRTAQSRVGAIIAIIRKSQLYGSLLLLGRASRQESGQPLATGSALVPFLIIRKGSVTSRSLRVLDT